MKITHALVNAFVVCLISAALLVTVSAARVTAEDSGAKIGNLEELKQQRKKATRRRRCIIFNNDGDDAWKAKGEATPEAFLECRTTPLLGTQVDTIFYCTTQCFGYVTHNTKVGEIFTSTVDPKNPDDAFSRDGGFSKNKTAEFIKQGTDTLKIMVDFCRKNDIEIFWSMRMNDTHDASSTWYGPVWFPQLKKDHPDWLLGSKQKPPKRAPWTAVDYGRKEIRDLA